MIGQIIPVKTLSVQLIANVSPGLRRALKLPKDCSTVGLISTDCDDATYIALDEATKAASVDIVFVDRFNGSLVINGTVSDVETAMKDVLDVLESMLHIEPTVITKT